MSKYSISRACGHEETVQIYGTNVRGEREDKAEWLATQLCTACYRAELAEQRARENEQAAAAATAAGLPALTGTPKQVAWATSIRQTILARVEEEADLRMLPGLRDHRLVEQTSASWWIDSRDSDPLRIVTSTYPESVARTRRSEDVPAGPTVGLYLRAGIGPAEAPDWEARRAAGEDIVTELRVLAALKTPTTVG